jgi:hypothetical protein
VFGEHSAHDIFVDVDTESPGNDQRYPWASETWIAALQLDNDIDDFLGRSLRSRFAPRFRCEERPVLAAHQTPVKAQQCRWLQARRNLSEPRRPQEKRAQAEKEPVTSQEVWRSLPRTVENYQLVFEEEILSDHSPGATGPEALGDSGQKVDDKYQYRPHSRED